MNIDITDIKILKLLQENSRIPIRQISQMVNMSEPSVRQRIEKLQDNNVLSKFTIDIDYKKIGFELPFILTIDNLKIDYNIFSKKIVDYNCITEIYSVTGKYNYFIKGYVKNLEELEILLTDIKKYGDAETFIILEEMKKNNLF